MNLKTKIGKMFFKNPIWVASGTFGWGEEFEGLVKLKEVGAVVAKTITLEPRIGNPPPRIVETPSGLLNSIGLENSGIEGFKREAFPFLKKIGTRFIVSIAGDTKEEFTALAEELKGKYRPDGIELNLSCPNVTNKQTKHNLIAQDPEAIKKIVRAVRKKTDVFISAKLTPNVTDISETAKAAETAGADAISLVNTYYGMAVDAQEMKPLLGNIVGGLSGPAIKPLALKAVYDAQKKVKIPIIGMGGIMTGIDVAEFMLCGASAVQIGTANLVNPSVYGKILKEFEEYLKMKSINNPNDLRGKIK